MIASLSPATDPLTLPPRAAGPISHSDGDTLSFVVWTLNDEAVSDQLQHAPTDMLHDFEPWIGTACAVQAWAARAAWIPEFDLYEDYNQTLYERASDLDWFRSGLNGVLASNAWTQRRLRYVAPLLWLGPDLAAAVDQAALARVADITRTGPLTRIALRSDASLNDLEAALEPILPMALVD